MYLAKPLRDLTKEDLAEQKITQEQFERARAQTLTRENELMRSVKSGSYRVIIKSARHESFSDEPFLLPDTGAGAETENRRLLRIVREYTLAFFDRYLRNKKSATIESFRIQPDVTVERFGLASRSPHKSLIPNYL